MNPRSKRFFVALCALGVCALANVKPAHASTARVIAVDCTEHVAECVPDCYYASLCCQVACGGMPAVDRCDAGSIFCDYFMHTCLCNH